MHKFVYLRFQFKKKCKILITVNLFSFKIFNENAIIITKEAIICWISFYLNTFLTTLKISGMHN